MDHCEKGSPLKRPHPDTGDLLGRITFLGVGLLIKKLNGLAIEPNMDLKSLSFRLALSHPKLTSHRVDLHSSQTVAFATKIVQT